MRPSQRRALVRELMQRFGCSQRNALRVMKMSVSTYLYKPVKKDESALNTRECLAIEVGQSLKREDVVRTFNVIEARRGLPGTIKTDNGSEFISKVMDKWAYERGMELDFSRPGKPTDTRSWRASVSSPVKQTVDS